MKQSCYTDTLKSPNRNNAYKYNMPLTRKSIFMNKLSIKFVLVSLAHGSLGIVFAAIPAVLCPAESDGLVHFPAIIAPFSGDRATTAECADNSHRDSEDLTVTCLPDGGWLYSNVMCVCDDGYRKEIGPDGRDICKG